MNDVTNPIPLVTHDDPAARSDDVVAENVTALKALFPSIITDGKVDLDVLRQLLGADVEDGEERYGLNWKGKKRARAFALTPSLGTLRPAREDSVNWDTTHNVVIEGDNLEVLKLLRKSYAGRVKLIYIDPPYNTGNDFVYPDDYQESLSTYERLTGQRNAEGVRMTSNKESSGRYHTDWLNMMYPRLMLAKDLLRQDGILMMSIDDHELANSKELLVDIFGHENFVITLVWEKGRKNDSTFFSETVEYIHIVARDKAALASLGTWREPKQGGQEVLAHYQELRDEYGDDHQKIESGMREFYDALPLTSPARKLRHFFRSDDRGLYFGGDISSASTSIPDYEVFHPVTGRPCRKPSRGWGCNPDEMERRIADGRVHFGEDENTIPLKKNYLVEVDAIVRSPVFYKDGRGASMEVGELLAKGAFSNPKDRQILSDLIAYTGTRDGIVLDFFAGSGTTGHSVMAQNVADGGSRRYILVQLPEPLDPADKDQKIAARLCKDLGKPSNLAELTKERLRRAGANIARENPNTEIDVGFRAYKLATSNLKPWQPDRDNLEASLLDAVDNVLSDRTEDDLLVELLLKTGIDLTLSSETRIIAGKTVHALGGGVLMVCLDGISEGEAEELGQRISDWRDELDPPRGTTFYFKDSGFQTAATKANLAGIIRQRLGKAGVEKLASI